jgi:hypothetical protein
MPNLVVLVRFVELSLREAIFLPGTKEVVENRECHSCFLHHVPASCNPSSLKAVIGTWFATPRLLRILHTVGPGVICSSASLAPNIDFKA